MRLDPVAILICLLGFATSFSPKRQLQKHEKEALGKDLKLDVDERAGRLQRLGRHLEGKRRATIGRRTGARKAVKHDPSPDNKTDLFKLNEQRGITPYLYQGDVHLTDQQLRYFEKIYGNDTAETEGRKKRQITTVVAKWPNGVVNYYLDPSINAEKTASITAALAYISSHTCIKYVQSSTATNRIKVFNGAGCYATVGMVGGEQTISIGDGCELEGIVLHEFTHALGSWHTQMRDDRDSYVTIDFSNIDPSLTYNFDALPANQTVNLAPYEYGSVMHYGAADFSTSATGLTITPKNENYLYTMGNRMISFYDMVIINADYGCNAKCSSSSIQCSNGGVPNPSNCATCNCPAGYGGATCNQRPSGCGSTLSASSSWSTVQINMGTSDSTTSRDEFSYCTWWITAPAGNTLQLQITSMYNPQCMYGCAYNGIQIKNNTDQLSMNPIVCCPEFQDIVYNSFISPTPIVAFNRYYISNFTVQYRYVSGTGGGTPPTTTAWTQPVTTAGGGGGGGTTAASSKVVCKDNTSNCAALKSSGYCTPSGSNTFGSIKYNCAKTCGMCGKAATPCADTYSGCASLANTGYCQSDAYAAEYQCEKSCGYCTNPI